MRRILSFIISIALLAAGPGSSRAMAEEAASLEYKVKAVCLYNFVKFIDWPAASLKSPDELSICIVGQNPFGSITKELEGREAQGKHVRVIELSSDAKPAELSRCNLAYLSSNGPAAEALLSSPETFRVATVSDEDPKAAIRFQVVDGKVRFAVNLEAAELARVKFSSQLLKLAVDTQ